MNFTPLWKRTILSYKKGVITKLSDNLITSSKTKKKAKVQHYEEVSSTIGIVKE